MPSSPVVSVPCTRPDRRGRSEAVTRATMIRAGAAILGSVLLASLGGCGGGPPPRLYLLEAPAATGTASPVPTVAGVDALGVAVASLPGYADDARIASREGRLGVSLDDDDRWAEAPDEALTRVFAAGLRRHAGATVLIEPWPRGFEPDARLELVVDRLLRRPDGGAEASGRVLVLSADGRELVAVRPFVLAEAGGSTAPEAYFAALATLVDRIARLAVEALGSAVGS